jgi:protein-S-isoprenylcysteine O-methyltransferase Ste14
MKPYFDTNHLAGLLLLIVTLGWGSMELSGASNTRDGAAKVGGGGRRIVVVPALIAGTVALYLAPRLVPTAAIRPGAAAFAVGLMILLAGLLLRGWSIKTLGEYFTVRVMVSAEQPVISVGPYGLLRHPSYAGLMLACTGLGLAAANWAGLTAMVMLPLAAVVWRIHSEENALMATLGDRYRVYAARHKRLVPLIW